MLLSLCEATTVCSVSILYSEGKSIRSEVLHIALGSPLALPAVGSTRESPLSVVKGSNSATSFYFLETGICLASQSMFEEVLHLKHYWSKAVLQSFDLLVHDFEWFLLKKDAPLMNKLTVWVDMCFKLEEDRCWLIWFSAVPHAMEESIFDRS